MTKDEVIEMVWASSCSPSEKWKLACAIEKLAEASNSGKPMLGERRGSIDVVKQNSRCLERKMQARLK